MTNLRNLLERVVAELESPASDDASQTTLCAEIKAVLADEPSAKAMPSCRPDPVPHSVLYDVAGWLCSVCGGWNAIHRKVCHHDHSSLNRPPDPGAWVCNVCGYPNQHGTVVCENAVTHPNRSENS